MYPRAPNTRFTTNTGLYISTRKCSYIWWSLHKLPTEYTRIQQKDINPTSKHPLLLVLVSISNLHKISNFLQNPIECYTESFLSDVCSVTVSGFFWLGGDFSEPRSARKLTRSHSPDGPVLVEPGMSSLLVWLGFFAAFI